MKKIILIAIIIGFSVSLQAQRFAVKNNLLHDATLTPNLAFEIGLGKKLTLDLYGAYNPFSFSEGKKFKHAYAQPELRYWLCERFNGTFLGLHLHGGVFNIGGIELPFDLFKPLKDHRYEGHFYGAGLSVGHQWVLSKRWALETSIGLGYARIHYDKYQCQDCGPKLKTDDKNYFGPTRALVTFAYFIR